MKKIALLLVLVNLVYLPLLAQFKVSGQVLNEKNKPLAFATITIYPLSDSTDLQGGISATTGSFLFNNLAPTDYKVIVQMIGRTYRESLLKELQLLVKPRVLIELFALALISMALPLFLLPKALKTLSPLYASILITAIPILTYFLQLFTGYYSFSAVKLGITILFSFSLIILAYSKKE